MPPSLTAENSSLPLLTPEMVTVPSSAVSAPVAAFTVAGESSSAPETIADASRASKNANKPFFFALDINLISS